MAAIEKARQLSLSRKPADEAMAELLETVSAAAEYFKPSNLNGGKRNRHADARLFYDFTMGAFKIMSEMLKYQKPQLRAILIPPPAPDQGEQQQRKRFTLTVFETPRQIEHKPAERAVALVDEITDIVEEGQEELRDDDGRPLPAAE